MKKSIITAIIAVMSCFILAACGSKEDTSLYGTYDLYAVEEDGMKFETAGLMDGSLTLEKGGKGSLVLDDTTDITWSTDGSKLTVKAGLSKIEGTIEKGIVMLDADGSIMYFAAKGADTSVIGADSMDSLLESVFSDALSELDEDETAGETEKAADAVTAADNEYYITAYTANGQTYDDPGMLSQLGMDETYVILNDDHTGYISLSGQGFDMNWSDDGQISMSGVPVYKFEREDANCIILNLYDTIFYKLERGKSNASQVKPAEKAETEAATEAETEAETEAVTEAESETETEAAHVLTEGEPVALGDGMATKDDVLRLMKYWDYCSDTGLYLSYEEMVEVVGVEGKDGGNDGPNSMTDYGDHMVTWYAGADNAFVYYTFRRPDDKDEWKAKQWMSQNIDRSEVDATDISDLLPSADPSSFVPTEEFTLKAFMTDIETKVRAAVPTTGWDVVQDNDYTVVIYNRFNDDRNAPRIEISVQSSEDRINFYLDYFENLKEIESRSISGISMKGRTYKNIGVDWTEWYGELASTVWVSINAGDLDVSEGSIANAIIESIEVK